MIAKLRFPFLVLIGSLLFAGCVSTPAPKVSLDTLPPSQVDRATRNLRVFNSVWSLVADRHYDPKLNGVDWVESGKKFGPLAAAAADKKGLYAVLNDMLAPLHDSHTHALTPEQADERQRHVYVRTGFSVARIEGRWVVTGVLPSSPADAAGLRVGWLVVARNGQKFGEKFDVKATEGEVAEWEFADASDQRVILALEAKALNTRVREVRVLEPDVVYLRFDEFDPGDLHWLSSQLKIYRDKPGCIVDLRQNRGGDTISLGFAVGEFFHETVNCGTFVARRGVRSEKNSWSVFSANYPGCVVILTDAATASAAEIFSAVLQDHGRATLIGRKTAGAVLVSWFYVLADGGELQLSREDYFAPKGRRLEVNGIEPDVKITRTLGDLRAGRDADIEAALRVLSAPKT